MQKLVPHLFLTHLLGLLANSKVRIIKNLLIKAFISLYKPDLNEAIYSDIEKYSSYNDFFTRKLKQGTRVIDNVNISFIYTVDG